MSDEIPGAELKLQNLLIKAGLAEYASRIVEAINELAGEHIIAHGKDCHDDCYTIHPEDPQPPVTRSSDRSAG